MPSVSFPAKLRVTILLAALASAGHTAETPPVPGAAPGPWGFNLSLYLWTTGVFGDFSAGSFSRSVDASFLDINRKSRRFPLGFMGRFEAHYDRFGFYLDGNYMDIALKPKAANLSNGVDAEMGLMDYGLMYRVFGPTAAEMPARRGKTRPNSLEIYAGARTFWLGSTVQIAGPGGRIQGTSSASKSFTSPVIGLRFAVEFTPEIFVLVDGNGGGFGLQDVSFTGGLLGLVGYRTQMFDIPMSVEAGYKLVRYNVDNGGTLETNATLNGPFLGLTGYW